MKSNLMIGSILYLLFLGVSGGLSAASSEYEAKTLFDWDTATGKDFTGWAYDSNVNLFGAAGWKWVDGSGRFGPCMAVSSICFPHSFNKTDYGENTAASIDNNVRAPSTTTGGSFLLDDSSSGDKQVSWYLWKDGRPLSEHGITDSTTDRMSFYINLQGMDVTNPSSPPTQNFHIGTYLCWGSGGGHQGEGCPYEGPGNLHFYHWLALGGGVGEGWIHVLLDQHPQHRRGRLNGEAAIQNDPVFASDGKHYFEQLSQFYMEVAYKQGQSVKAHIDEVEFYSTSNTSESLQNNVSISSLWVGYWPEGDYWEIGFHDSSISKYDSFSHSTFEIRWSTSPITNANWNLATPINALYFGDSKHTPNGPGSIRRITPTDGRAWTRFQLDDNVEATNNKLFFAVKDVSIAGQGSGAGFPYNYPDSKSAPNSYVTVIDYNIAPGSSVIKSLALPPEMLRSQALP